MLGGNKLWTSLFTKQVENKQVTVKGSVNLTQQVDNKQDEKSNLTISNPNVKDKPKLKIMFSDIVKLIPELVVLYRGSVHALLIHGPNKGGKPMLNDVKQLTLTHDGRIKEEANRTFDHRPNKLKVNEDPKHRQLSFASLLNIEALDLIQCEELNGKPGALNYKTMRCNLVLNLPVEYKMEPDTIYIFEHADGSWPTICVFTMERDPCRIMDFSVCNGISIFMKNGNCGGFLMLDEQSPSKHIMKTDRLIIIAASQEKLLRKVLQNKLLEKV